VKAGQCLSGQASCLPCLLGLLTDFWLLCVVIAACFCAQGGSCLLPALLPSAPQVTQEPRHCAAVCGLPPGEFRLADLESEESCYPCCCTAVLQRDVVHDEWKATVCWCPQKAVRSGQCIARKHAQTNTVTGISQQGGAPCRQIWPAHKHTRRLCCLPVMPCSLLTRQQRGRSAASLQSTAYLCTQHTPTCSSWSSSSTTGSSSRRPVLQLQKAAATTAAAMQMTPPLLLPLLTPTARPTRQQQQQQQQQQGHSRTCQPITGETPGLSLVSCWPSRLVLLP
jgi:hypothetical protein